MVLGSQQGKIGRAARDINTAFANDQTDGDAGNGIDDRRGSSAFVGDKC